MTGACSTSESGETADEHRRAHRFRRCNHCSIRGPRATIEQHQPKCCELHRELDEAQEEVERLEEDRANELRDHEDVVDELTEEVEYLRSAYEEHEGSIEAGDADLYTVAKRLLALEDHLGLQPSVTVDDDCGCAEVIKAPAVEDPPPAAPLALQQPPPALADQEDWVRLGVNLRPVNNPTVTQSRLHKRLMKSFKAKQAAEEAKVQAARAAEDSSEEEAVVAAVRRGVVSDSQSASRLPLTRSASNRLVLPPRPTARSRPKTSSPMLSPMSSPTSSPSSRSMLDLDPTSRA